MILRHKTCASPPRKTPCCSLLLDTYTKVLHKKMPRARNDYVCVSGLRSIKNNSKYQILLYNIDIIVVRGLRLRAKEKIISS